MNQVAVDTIVVQRARRAAQTLAGVVAIFAAATVVLRLSGLADPDSSFPEALRLRSLAAAGLTAAGAGLIGVSSRRRWLRLVGFGLLSTSAVVGWLHFGGTEAAAAQALRSLPSPSVAIGFLLTSIAGALLFVAKRRAVLIAQGIAIVLVLLSLNALFDYAYQTEDLYRAFGSGGVSFASAIAFGVLGAACLYSDCRWGVGSVLVEATPSGELTRRLVPTVIVTPLLLGGIAVEGLRRHWFGNGLANSLITTGSTMVVIGALYLSIRRLWMSDTERNFAVALLEGSEALFRESFENAFIGIAHLDGQGRCLRANEQLASMLNCEVADLEGRDLAGLVHSDDVAGLTGSLQLLERGEERSIHGSVRCVARGRGAFPCDMRVTAYRDHAGVFWHFTFIVLDVSAQKRLAAERERLLVTAVEERNRARDAAHARDVLLAVVSHELRSPLNAIRLWTSLMQADGGDLDTQQRALHQIENSVVALSRLIDDLLDVSRIESGGLELESVPVDLRSLVREIVAQQQPAAAVKSLQLSAVVPAESPVVVDGDELRLGQVVRNLLDNAIKFTPVGGRIVVTVNANDHEAELAVADTGEGVPADQLDKIFAQFRQVDDRVSRRHAGLGLGLYIVRRIVERHGGSVTAHSDGVDKGARFVVALPLAAGVIARQEFGPSRLDAEPAATGDILVVDDQADTCEALALALRMRGHDVRTATSTKEALTLIAECRPRVLISDLMMPDESGYDLIKSIRDAEFRDNLPRSRAIAISGAGGHDARRAARRSGFDQYLAKPVQVRVLVEWIESSPATTQMRSILLVGAMEALETRLRADGHVLGVASKRAEAERLAKDMRPSFVIVDLDDDQLDGARIARKLRGELPTLVIGLTEGPVIGDDELDFVVSRSTAWESIARILHSAAAS